MLRSTYTSPTQTKTFSKETEETPIPVDTSRDALKQPEPTDPLYKVRMDAISVQHQMNVFFTDEMAREKAQQPQ